MAEKKPQPKRSTTTTTTPKGGGRTGTMQYVDAGSPEAQALLARAQGGSAGGYLSSYEDELAGIKVFGGYRPGARLSGGRQGPVAKQAFDKTAVGMLRTLLNKKNNDPWVRQLQEALFKAGFYGNAERRDIRWGLANDPATVQAYVDAIRLTSATNSSGNLITVPSLLQEMGNYRSASQVAQVEGPRFAYQPEDPAKIRRLIDEAMPEILGHKLSAEETEALVARWQEIAESDARAAFSVQQSGGVASPQRDFETFVLDEVERTRPDDVYVKKLANMSKLFLEAISKPLPETQRF